MKLTEYCYNASDFFFSFAVGRSQDFPPCRKIPGLASKMPDEESKVSNYRELVIQEPMSANNLTTPHRFPYSAEINGNIWQVGKSETKCSE